MGRRDEHNLRSGHVNRFGQKMSQPIGVGVEPLVSRLSFDNRLSTTPRRVTAASLASCRLVSRRRRGECIFAELVSCLHPEGTRRETRVCPPLPPPLSPVPTACLGRWFSRSSAVTRCARFRRGFPSGTSPDRRRGKRGGRAVLVLHSVLKTRARRSR